MKNKLEEFRAKLKNVTDKLEEKNIFKGLGITYQVFWNLLLVFVVLGLMGTFFVGGAGAGFFASLVKDEPLRPYEEMKKDIYDYEEMSQIYFANDVYLGELPYELERREVKLEDVSEYLVQAIIATEDEYFYEHNGIVPKAIMRATLQEVANSSVQTGGSTLTQQLVKNQILTSDVSFDRKAREMLLAMRLETFFNKDEILEAYLNVVPFGRNASRRNIAGVQSAAQGIFGVDAKDLSLPQAAYIAGLPQSPFGYTPFTSNGEVKQNLDPGINRMKTVLRRMKDSGYITESEYESALDYDIRANLTTRTPSSIEEYPYLTNEVLRRATEVLAKQMMVEDNVIVDELEGEDRVSTLTQYREQARRDLRRNGYRIHTTVNKGIYDSMQETVKDDRYFGPDREGEKEEVGAILIENRTGAIISFVGGRNFEEQELNHATQAYRSNGSTMKPILSYAAAIDIGAIHPASIIPDTPATYPDGTPFGNFDNSYRGLITARDALKYSRNVPAVRAQLKIPHEKARETLLKYNFNLEEGEPYPSASLGRTRNDVTVEQNTAAYATFANDGNFVESYMIDRIETKEGEVIFQHEINPVEVFSPQTAYLMVDMMRDVLRSGTATYLPGRIKFKSDWTGKTGTSNDFHDAWFVGLNPNVTMSVWIGYDTPKSIQQRGVAGLSYSQRTQQIWANLINSAYDSNPELIASQSNFEMPNGIVRRSICGISGLLPSDLCQEAGLVRSDLFNAQFVPTKIDDSLTRVKYVLLNEQPYIALDSTPDEFTYTGVAIKEEYIQENQLKDYLPESLNNVIPDRLAQENGKQPDQVSNVALSGSQLTWSKHHENDIVGYRIYRTASGSSGFSLVGSVRTGSYSFNVNNAGFAYYVTAVDVAGKESAPSQTAKGQGWIVEEDNDEDKTEEDDLLELPENNNGEKEKENEKEKEEKKNENDNGRKEDDQKPENSNRENNQS
ncbi:transglycosylase domain-containing protein [Bacillus sp. FJAT-45350]|uniref:transglycosylase domain-containing protein n=1 Tax=Bacillus sp. FJAT-45350 TaxID=2011014 RepID=UPI000BB775F6|nr:transglycosylase domain-containing protein [Bacillus sp. FJAT-45350]